MSISTWKLTSGCYGNSFMGHSFPQEADSRLVYSNPWIRVRVDEVVRPDQLLGIYSVVELKGGVGVVVLDEQSRVLVVGQFRYPLNRYSWEIPKGAFPSFEDRGDPLETAKRELQEETGVTGAEWTYLGCVHTLMGSTNDEVHLFSVRKLTIGEPEPEGTEVLQSRWVEQEQFWKMVERGDITDATSIAAFALSLRKT